MLVETYTRLITTVIKCDEKNSSRAKINSTRKSKIMGGSVGDSKICVLATFNFNEISFRV